MARGVEIEWTSKDEAVLRGFQKVENNLDSIARKLDKVEAASKKAAKETETGFDKVTKKATGYAQALIGGGSVLTAVDMVKRANLEVIRSADEAAKKQEELFKAFRGQAGLSALEGDEARKWILANAEKNAVSSEVAKAAAGGLVSAGFSTKDATVGGLNVLLRAQAAYVQSGKNPGDSEELSKNLASYMDSQGMAKTPQNLEKLLQDAFALRAGQMELSDLSELGKHGAAFRGYLSPQEQLAAFGSLRDTTPAAEAGTTLRNVVQRLSTAGTTLTGKKALTRIGLTPEDVDFVGENFDTILDRVGGGLAGLPQEDQDDVLKLLFEQASVAGAQTLLNERNGKFDSYLGGMANAPRDFNASANVLQSGPNAALARIAVRKERYAADAAQRDDVMTQYLDEQFKLQPSGTPFRRTLADAGYWGARGFGASQEQAADFAYGDATGGINMVEAARRQRAIDEGQPIRVEIVNPEGAPAVNRNAVQGFGR